MSATSDRELDATRNAVDTFESVSDLAAVLAVLREHASRRTRIELLDLIGHSFSHGFLVLGTWAIDDTPQTAPSFGMLMRPFLEQLGVRTIRLLGCSTAASAPARNAMRQIVRATGYEVFGTRRYISHRDYGPVGFTSEHALVAAADLAA